MMNASTMLSTSKIDNPTKIVMRQSRRCVFFFATNPSLKRQLLLQFSVYPKTARRPFVVTALAVVVLPNG